MTTYTLVFSKSAEKVLKKWKKSNPQLFSKAAVILHELQEHPRTGVGHPEPLKGGDDVTWSRHVTAHDRIVYDIHDEIITIDVITIEGHYADK